MFNKGIRNSIVIVLIFLGGFFISATSVDAFSSKTGNSVVISKNETIDGTLFIGARTIRIAGTVNGDVICGGQQIDITGRINGDIICAGQTIHITGTVNGNVRVVGEDITIAGQVMRNATIFGQTILSSATIMGDLYVNAQSFILTGAVFKGVEGIMNTATINAYIGNNVNLNVTDVFLGSRAYVNGSLIYRSTQPIRIQTGAKVTTIHRVFPPTNQTSNQSHNLWFIFARSISLVTHLFVALLLIGMWPIAMTRITTAMRQQPGKFIGRGVILFFLTPLAIMCLLVTIIGIPIAFLLGIVYVMSLFVSRVFVSVCIGRLIVGEYWKEKQRSLPWAAIIGTILAWAIYTIPIFGLLASIAAVFWGLIRPSKLNIGNRV